MLTLMLMLIGYGGNIVAIILVLGAIAAIIIYVYQLRANKRLEEEESKKPGYGNDIFNISDDPIPFGNEQHEEKYLYSNPYDDLERLASLYEKDIITKEEFEKKKKELLDRI